MTGLVTLRRLRGALLLLAFITTLGLLGCTYQSKPYRVKRPHPDATPEPIDDLSITDVPHRGHPVRVILAQGGRELITTGELLAVTTTGVILIPQGEGVGIDDQCPTLVPAQKVRSIEILDTGHKTSYLRVVGSTLGVTALTISNGFGLLLTAPVTLAVGGLWLWEMVADQSLKRGSIKKVFDRFARYPSSFDFSAFSDCSLEEGVADFKAPKSIDPSSLQRRGVTDQFELRVGLIGSHSFLNRREDPDLSTQQEPFKGLFDSSMQPGGFVEGLFHFGARLSVSLMIEGVSPVESRVEYYPLQDSGEMTTSGFLTQNVFSYRAGVEVVALRDRAYHGLLQLGVHSDGYTYSYLLKRAPLDLIRAYIGFGLRLEGPMEGHLIAIQLSSESDEFLYIDSDHLRLTTPITTSLKWALVF